MPPCHTHYYYFHVNIMSSTIKRKLEYFVYDRSLKTSFVLVKMGGVKVGGASRTPFILRLATGLNYLSISTWLRACSYSILFMHSSKSNG